MASPATTAAALCRGLRQSGTGEYKLNLIRALLDKDPNADAEAGYAALASDPKVTTRTLEKARGLIDLGVIPEPQTVEGAVPVEDLILAVQAKDREARMRADPFAEQKAKELAAAKERERIKAEMEAEKKRLEDEAKKQKEAEAAAKKAAEEEAKKKAGK